MIELVYLSKIFWLFHIKHFSILLTRHWNLEIRPNSSYKTTQIQKMLIKVFM